MDHEDRDRRAGSLLGLAVGDALGGTYEFCGPDDVPQGPLEMVGGGWLSLRPGETTDDTALTKAVLEGYAEGALDLGRVREAMLRWLATDPKDVGCQTRRALNYLRRNPEAEFPPEDPDAQGNGAVMCAVATAWKLCSAEIIMQELVVYPLPGSLASLPWRPGPSERALP